MNEATEESYLYLHLSSDLCLESWYSNKLPFSLRMEEEEGTKTRSFGHEGYNTRRAFLTSYPLQCEDQVEQQVDGEDMENTNLSLKSKFIAIFQWREDKVILLRKIKNKVALYLVSCKPFAFKSSKKMLTLKPCYFHGFPALEKC